MHLTGLFLGLLSAFSQSAQTLTGTLSDSMCGAKSGLAEGAFRR